jgi:signal transduction histidine kinase
VATKRSTARLEGRVGQLEAALQRVRGVGEALRRVTMAVGAVDEIEELLQLIIDTTTDVLDAERATLYLLADNGSLVSRVKKGAELREIVIPVGRGIAGHVAKTGKALRIKDAYKDKRFDRVWDKKSGYRTSSILAVPLTSHSGETIGVLQVLNKIGADDRARLFTPYDTELLKALAMQAAVSLEKAALFSRLRSKNELLEQTTRRLERSLLDLELLYQLETEMSRADSVEQLARSVINLAGRACSAAAGALLVQPLGGDLTLYVVNLRQPEEVRPVIVQSGEGIAARAMGSGELLRIDDPKKVRDPRRVREMLGISVKSAIAAPLGSENAFAGALALYNHNGRPSRFTKADARLLELVSANVGTELRVQESRVQRERAERLGSIGKLLSGVMHDLRTPLTVVSGYVQLMQVADDPAVRTEYATTVAEQFEIISGMQRDLLSYARGETKLLIRKVYLGRFCELLGRQFKPEMEAEGIALKMDIRNNGTAYFDERGLGRAIGNLVRNAIEAMETVKTKSKRKLTIVCDRDDEDLILSVTDTGRGIPKAIRGSLFEPFVTKGKKMGTGLGLANVKKIVEEHGGTVDVRSSRRGTCFTVLIPNAMRPHSLILERRSSDE